jgi:hypothetical protein
MELFATALQDVADSHGGMDYLSEVTFVTWMSMHFTKLCVERPHNNRGVVLGLEMRIHKLA